MKKYALLYFQQINDKFSKWLFPLHEGDNIIGSDKDVDIFLYLNEKIDIIDNVHCNIIVNEIQNDISIINLASKGCIKRGEGDEKIILSPGKEYELNNKTVFYLTDNVKFMLIKGTIDEIHNFLLEENLENEFQKWHQLILSHENNTKINLNLTRKESYNKSFISNISKNENNNINLNHTSNNNNNNLLNSAISNRTLNNNISNSILGSNSKEINRIGFNNFDEFPDDNLINDYKLLQQNLTNSAYNKNLINIKNPVINTSPIKIIDNNNPHNNQDNNMTINNNTNINDKINIDTSKNYNIIINEKEKEKSEIISNDDKNLNNNENDKNIKNNKTITEYNNPLDLFKQASSEFKKYNNYNEKVVNKDEKTIQTIKELLGENNLDIIFENTNYKDIKKYDIIFKKTKNNKGVGLGNLDIQVKTNDFLSNNVKYEHKNKIKTKK